ncbi:amidohydrolase family protein [Mycobacterium intracellulare]|uniref:amidohydrolase family protein n=1 Tax=Mycobacterium intracellulare TaxID=1767 RepID=UPI00334732ED
MIIDCHGHYTTTPPAHQDFRDAQLAGRAPSAARISDDEIRESIEPNQLRLMRERGVDLMLFSPKASGMEHHVVDPVVATQWARACNDLVHRAVSLFPAHFAAVCQLPQTPDGNLSACVEELRRCVVELGFVGCNLNPDPSGGQWSGTPLTDRSWYSLYETMVELDVPAMIHVSSSCNANISTLGAHYLNADTTAFMQLVEQDLFGRFPTLRFVIPHGGGAVPYHWGRFQGLAERFHRPPLADHLMDNVYFDTCVYHRPGIELLLSVIGADNVVFGSEMMGAVRGSDPRTGIPWDDTKRYIDDLDLPFEPARKVFELNAKRVYPRLDARLNVSIP